MLTEKGEEQAIKVFATNLKNLLLQPPISGKVIMGIDPGFRSGCKVAVIDQTGKYLEGDTIYPHPPQNKYKEAKNILNRLVNAHSVDMEIDRQFESPMFLVFAQNRNDLHGFQFFLYLFHLLLTCEKFTIFNTVLQQDLNQEKRILPALQDLNKAFPGNDLEPEFLGYFFDYVFFKRALITQILERLPSGKLVQRRLRDEEMSLFYK